VEDAMLDTSSKLTRTAKKYVIGFAVVALAGVAISHDARGDEAFAKTRLKAMSDYMAAQKAVSFDYDSTLEVVSTDNQKVGLASSGKMTLNRPDKMHGTRTGGFADIEFAFDGKTLTFLGKHANAYAQVEAPGTIDQLIDVLRDKYHRPVPGADLLLSNIYDQLEPEVKSTKDLGAGVIGGVECDHLAFRTSDVDWQIWIAQGDRPYPCRYVITSPKVAASPQYSIDIRSWKTGSDAATDSFSLQLPKDAKKVAAEDVPEFDELPSIFALKK
jgi:hypothetical protein